MRISASLRSDCSLWNGRRTIVQESSRWGTSCSSTDCCHLSGQLESQLTAMSNGQQHKWMIAIEMFIEMYFEKNNWWLVFQSMWPCFGSEGRNGDAARVTMIAIVKAFNSVMRKLPDKHRGQCQLELIPIQVSRGGNGRNEGLRRISEWFWDARFRVVYETIYNSTSWRETQYKSNNFLFFQ